MCMGVVLECVVPGMLRLVSLMIKVLVHISLKWWIWGWARMLSHVSIERCMVMVRAYSK